MRRLSIAISLFLLSLLAHTSVEAQSWIEVRPEEEHFSVQMPRRPTTIDVDHNVGQFNVSGLLYSTSNKGIEYRLWSLKNPAFADYKSIEGESYSDAVADLVWDGLLRPWRNAVPKDSKLPAYMQWQNRVEGIRRPGNNYVLLIENIEGLVQTVAKEDQIYVLVVMNTPCSSDEAQHFINSFLRGSETPEDFNEEKGGAKAQGETASGNNTGTGTGVLPTNAPVLPSNPTTDYNGVFPPREVTQKARVLTKPEPQYTERARRYAVTGTVVLRGVFSRTGEVTNIHVMSGLPFGLTQKCIVAARQMKFTPAVKDGHDVSMYIQLEYNFNLY